MYCSWKKSQTHFSPLRNCASIDILLLLYSISIYGKLKLYAFWDWENAAKELALSGGAFVIAGGSLENNKNTLIRFLNKLIPFGSILFSITIISFGIDHFIYAKEASDYVPLWIPYHLFWMYFTGTALIGAGLTIILKIKAGLVATLLGTMIFTWFIILHIPRVIASPVAYIGSEVTSAFIALAYSGIAFAIAGAAKRRQ